MMSRSVGKAEKSVGFLTYNAIKIISAESAIETAKKKSSKELGRGTMMIARIAMIKKTTVRSFEPDKKDKKGIILLRKETFLSAAAKSTPQK